MLKAMETEKNRRKNTKRVEGRERKGLNRRIILTASAL